MDHSSSDAFERYSSELIQASRVHPLITGLVFMGSTADRSRIDEWSDHDFAVIAEPADVETLRDDLRWLPRADQIVARAREWHDGFKAIYADGAVVEFAVTDLTGLSTFLANSWEVVYGGEPVRSVMETVAAKRVPSEDRDAARDMTVFLTALLVGVGRSRRGEGISGSGSVRGLAVDHLLSLLAQFVPATDRSRLDNLDGRRRFELVYPALGAELVRALSLPLDSCAETLLTLAERELGHRWPEYPTAAVTAVRARLGWS